MQLRCLNLIRQYTHRNEYDYSHLADFRVSNESILEKVDICLQRLRLAAMCWADTAPVLLEVFPNGNNIDMKSLHYCRNFEDINAWVRAHQIEDIWANDLF